jgi:CubicO group peptidase (beta-lactamase class C family)
MLPKSLALPRTSALLGPAGILVCSWGLGGCVLGLSNPPPPEGSASLGELEAYVDELIVDQDPPSLSIAVSAGETNLYERAFGLADGPREVPATPDTTYRWFSVTKPFTAVAILQLAEVQALDLKEPAATYLPFLHELYGENASAITIERLLSHRAGIGDVGNGILSWVHVDGHYNQSQLLRERLPAHAHFDTKQLDRGHYSNLGYMILGAVIEAVSSETYEDYVTRHISLPLGLQHTRFYYEADFPPGTPHAVGSHPDDFMAFVASFTLDLATLSRECTRQRWWFEAFSPDQTPPSGLISTSADMVRFGRMILGGGVLDGQRVLTAASVARMIEPEVAVASSPAGDLPGFSFGASWFIGTDARGRQVLMHGGQGMAFTSLLLIRPEDDFVAALVANGTYIDGANGMHLMEAIGNTQFLP